MSDHAKGANAPHVAPIPLYLAVFGVLIVMTGVTVYAAGLDFGRWNTPVALGIAALKATFVVIFFMHVKWSTRLTWLFAAAGFAWLLVMFGFTFSDYLARPWMDIYYDKP